MDFKMMLHRCINLLVVLVTSSGMSFVSCLSGPEFVKVPDSEITFTNNTGTRLECVAHGDPMPTVSWMGLDKTVTRSIPGIREVWLNGTLLILPFSASQYRIDVHASQYQCQSANSLGSIIAPPITLTAVVVQDLDVRLYEEFVTVGNTAVMRCVIPSVSRNLATVTAWERDSSVHIYPSLHGDGKYHVVPDGRLLIHNVEASDSHVTFRCRILHTLSGRTAVSNVARIIVNDPTERFPPRIVTKATSLDLKLDTPIVIPCIAHGHPVPKYRWLLKNRQNSDPIELSESNPMFRSLKAEDGVLVFATTQTALIPSSARSIICEAYNVIGSTTREIPIERLTTISVNVTPKLLIVDSRSSGEFRCTVTRHPHNGIISWYRNGIQINPSGRISLRNGGALLRLSDVRSTDVGMFQCFVKTKHQVLQSSAELRLGASPPEFIYRFIQQTLTPGPSVSLKCIAKASPTPVFEWQLDGFPLPHLDRVLVGQYVTLSGEVVSHVNISHSRVVDGGEYTCKALNSVGEVSHSAPLYIYGPPHIRSMGYLTAISGEVFRVKCPVAGYPLPTIKWSKGSRSLPLDRRHKLSGPIFEIEDVSRESDEGEYTCTASDRRGRQVSQKMTVKVVERPIVAPFSIPEALIAGSRMAVQCLVVKGDPPIKMEWFHGHQSAASTPGVTVNPLGQFVLTLMINEVSIAHEGNYSCKATSTASDSSTSHSAYLRVHVPPAIKKFEFGRLVSGMRAQATCLVQTGDPPVTIAWLRNNEMLVSGPDLTVHLMDTFTSILILPKVLPKHSGNYTCVARNSVREEKYTAQLLVRVAPRWKQDPKDVATIKGKDSILNCNADGYPIPKVSWKKSNKDGSLNVFHGTPGYQSMPQTFENGSLLIQGATAQDEGSYLCEVSNGVGKGLSAIVTLSVHAPPKISGDTRIEAKRGDSVSLKCKAQGDPPLSLSFSRDGHPVDPSNVRYTSDAENNFIQNNNLNSKETEKIGDYLLERVTPLDSGKYKCVATNPFGSETLEMQLIIQDAPPIPRNLKVKEEKSRSVILSWSNSGSAHVTHFNLLLKRLDESLNPTNWDNSDIQKVKVDSNRLSHNLNNLQPATNYEVKVVAVNSVGQSPPSEPIMIRTEGEPPSGALRNLVANPISSREVKLEWTVPDESTWHGRLLGYNIGIRKASNQKSNFSFETASRTSGESTSSFVVKGLQAFTPYIFVARTFNSYGSGPMSKEVHATTHEDVPKGPPMNFVCTTLTSSRIEVVWGPPQKKLSNGKITSYTVSFVPLIEGDPKADKRVTTELRTALGNLRPFTNYSITVAASTRAGMGVSSDPLICETEEDVPEQPSEIKSVVSGSTSVVVAWAPPKTINGRLTKYTLYFQTDRDRSPKRRTVPSQTKFLEVTGLREGKEVQLWMTASTRVGEGSSTARTSAIPTKAVPAGIHAVNTDLNISRGRDVLLPCPHSGFPAPQLTWKVNGRSFSNENWSSKSRWSQQNDGSFLIRDLKKEDAGNFSCHVTNYHGSDEVTYRLGVLVPPSAFILRVVSSSSDSLKVAWIKGDSGGSPIIRLNLTWRPASGEWREKTLPWHLKTSTLNDLSCGTEHHLYLTAFNALGPGDASNSVTAKTKGNKPHSPSKNQILIHNSTTAVLNLFAFNDPECATQNYFVKMRPLSSQHWISESGKLPGNQRKYVIPNLKLKTQYLIEVNAINDAGENSAQYSFLSSDETDNAFTVVGGELLVPKWDTDEANLYTDPAFIIPVIISCLALLVIAGAIGICCIKKPTNSSITMKAEDKTTWKEPSLYGTIRKSQPSDLKSVGDSSIYTDEIHPYATFQLKPYDDTSVSSSMQTYTRILNHGFGSSNNGLESDGKTESKNIVRGRARSLSRGSDYARGRAESEDYGGESGYSDSDIDTLPSSKTGGYGKSSYQPSVIRSAHHNMLYVASDVSSIQSPEKERKSLPRKMKASRSSSSASQRDKPHEPPNPFSNRPPPPLMSDEPRLLTHGIVRPKFTSKTPLHFQHGNLKKVSSNDALESKDSNGIIVKETRRHKKMNSDNLANLKSSRERLEFSETECDMEGGARVLSKKTSFSIAV